MPEPDKNDLVRHKITQQTPPSSHFPVLLPPEDLRGSGPGADPPQGTTSDLDLQVCEHNARVERHQH